MDTTASYASIPQRFKSLAQQHPERVAVSSSRAVLTYGQLSAKMSDLSRELQSRGLRAGETVGLHLGSSFEMITAMLGVLDAGGVYVMLEPSLPLERRRYMAADLELRMILSDALSDTSTLIEPRAQPRPAPSAASAITDASLACIYLTSGSTGRPKGVAITHGNILYMALESGILRFSEEVFLQLTPAGFDPSTIEIWGALLNGGRLALYEGARGDLVALGETLTSQKVTTLLLVTGVFHQIADWKPSVFRGVRQLMVGGDVISAARVRRVLEAAPGVEIINAYGPTEGGTVATYRMKRADDVLDPVPIGRVAHHALIRVVDGDCRSVPRGEPGELCVGGKGLCSGYVNRAALNQALFFEDPPTHQRFYKTGDRVRLTAEGELLFLGRVDGQVKVRGVRVELGEVEAQLQQDRALTAAAVVAIGDTAEARRLVAFVVPRAGAGVDETRLRAELARHLPESMIPSAFIALEALPLSHHGKVDKELLKSRAEAREATPSTHKPPSTDTERAIGRIWETVLGASDLGAQDSFFSIGGNSLAAAQVAARVGDAFGIHVPLRVFYAAPTVEGLARFVDSERKAARRAPPIRRLVRRGDVPLSTFQERIWFLEQLQPGNLAYNCGALLNLKGTLHAEHLEAALARIIARHEVTRTTVAIGAEGRPVQRVHEPWAVQLPIVDLSHLDVAAARRAMMRQVEGEFLWRFRLEQLPLLRWVLFKLSGDEHSLLCMEHHFLHDGWSFNVFLKELLSHYKERVEGGPSLPPLGLQYADLALEQLEYLRSGALEQQLGYWKKQLEGCPPRIQLPTDRPRPAAQKLQGNKLSFTVPKRIVDALEEVAKREQTSLFMLAMSVFQVLIQRYSRQTDFAITTSVSNRRSEESERLIGMVLNSVPLRAQVDPDAPFRTHLRRVKQTALAAYAHQDAPFEKIVDAVNPSRALSGPPFFQVMFNFHHAPSVGVRLKGLTAELSILTSNGSAKCDINVIMAPRSVFNVTGDHRNDDGDHLLIWEYDTDLFDEPTMKGYAARFVQMLESVPAALTQRVRDLSWASADEEAYLREQSCGPRLEYAAEEPLHETIRRWAAVRPDETAVMIRRESLTWRELEARADGLARHLLKMGVRPGDTLGLLTKRSLETVIAALAVLKTGACYVCLDPGLPLARLSFIVQDAGIETLLFFDAAERHAHLGGRTIDLATFDWRGAGGAPLALPRVSAEQAAVIIYTSGSTGGPKGVRLSHRNIAFIVASKNTIGVQGEHVYLQMASLSFDASLLEIYGALLNGRPLVLFPPEARLDEAQDVVRQSNATTAFFPTSLFHRLAEDQVEVFTGLREVIVGGEALQAGPARKLFERHPHTTLINIYGPTESTVFTTCFVMTSAEGVPDTIPLGRTISGGETWVLDRHLEVVPTGVPGEVYVGGDGLGLGYLNREPLTAERFVAHPFDSRRRVYKTGDIAVRRADGNLYFLGRTDFQVKIRGFRVELEEVEKSVSALEGVGGSAVLAVKDPSGANRLVAWVEAPPDRRATLAAQIAATLPDFMVPSELFLVERLLLNHNGKVDRGELARWYESDERTSASPGLASPETMIGASPTERAIAEIWCRLLECKSVGRDAEFFALGGHSLLAAQMLVQVNTRLATQIPMRAFYGKPTLAALAQLAEGKAEVKMSQEAGHIAGACLPDDIQVASAVPREGLATPHEVLVTGGTGFLGAHLVFELLRKTDARVHVLVRAADHAEAVECLHGKLRQYELPFDEARQRLEVHVGDIAEDRFGLAASAYLALARSVQIIYHSAASTNFTLNYAQIAGANVNGTLEVIRFAIAERTKVLHHVSSVSVFATPPGGEGPPFKEDGEIGPPERLGYGYAQSKWAAEKLVMAAEARGLPVSIYRPSRIAGHAKTGRWHDGDFLVKVLRGCAALGAIPKLNRLEDMVAVDYVAQAIVWLSLQPSQIGKRFHLTNPVTVSWDALGSAMQEAGLDVAWVDYDEWFARVRALANASSDNPLVALLPLFEGGGKKGWERRLCFETSNTERGLAGSGLRCVEIDAPLMSTYLNVLIRDGVVTRAGG